MSKEMGFFLADAVRKKREKWEMINISNFAKGMKKLDKERRNIILGAEECCDSLHGKTMRRDKTEVRSHSKRLVRMFIFYTVYKNGIIPDKLGAIVIASLFWHDVPEDVSPKLLNVARSKYGFSAYKYIDLISKDEDESLGSYLARVLKTDTTIFMKLIDSVDNGLSMLDEYYIGLDSAPAWRLETYFNEKVIPFLEMAKRNNFEGARYEYPIKEVIEDLDLVCQEASQAFPLIDYY